MTSPVDGYSLYRLLAGGQSRRVEVKGATYHCQFEGEKTGVGNWLRVTDMTGDSIRLSPGWSTEACWNALTTIERGRWQSPVSPWKDPSEWGGADEVG